MGNTSGSGSGGVVAGSRAAYQWREAHQRLRFKLVIPATRVLWVTQVILSSYLNTVTELVIFITGIGMHALEVNDENRQLHTESRGVIRMVFCSVRQDFTPKIPAVVEAIEDGSMHVFSNAHRFYEGRECPFAVCLNCTILSKYKSGNPADYTDCRFFPLLYPQDEKEA